MDAPHQLALGGDAPDHRDEQDFTVYTDNVGTESLYVYGGFRIGESKATDGLHKLDVAACVWSKVRSYVSPLFISC
jgi:hypothetical protein